MTTERPVSEEDLQAFVDGALSTVRHAEVTAYLRRQPEIAARVETFITQRTALRAALAPIAEEPLPPELNLARLIERHRRGLWPSWRALAASVALFALGGAAGWSLHSGSGAPMVGIPALAQEAADSYEVYAPDHGHAVELHAAESGELVRWLSARLNHPVMIPDLAASGYRFMGGRLVATAHGPAGLLMYDDDRGTRLVLLVRPMAVDPNARMTEHRRDGVMGYAWATAGMGYSLEGPAATPSLHPLANEARRQISSGI